MDPEASSSTHGAAPDDPEVDTASETRAISYQEVPNNHLSPMGQVDDVGRFARGAGPERLTRWFRWGIVVVAAMAAIGVVTSLFG